MFKFFKRKTKQIESIPIKDKIQRCIEDNDNLRFLSILDNLKEEEINEIIDKYRDDIKFINLYENTAVKYICSFDYFKYDLLSDSKIAKIISKNVKQGIFGNMCFPNICLKNKNIWLLVFASDIYYTFIDFKSLNKHEYNDDILIYILKSIDTESKEVEMFFENNVKWYLSENPSFKKILYDICLDNQYVFKYTYCDLEYVQHNILEILSDNGKLINMIPKNKVTEEMRVASIKNNPLNIRYIDPKDINIELFKLAIDKDPHCIKYIKDPSDAMFIYTFAKDKTILDDYNTSLYLNKKSMIYILYQCPEAILKIENADESLWKIALECDGLLLKYLKNQTEELVKIAIKENEYAKKYSLFISMT